ncbi:MAG: sulfatase [Candidatus Aminicenantes bacterium]|nr:MAG: sulfatase [Candidatus Aminicenantes bacterium]
MNINFKKTLSLSSFSKFLSFIFLVYILFCTTNCKKPVPEEDTSDQLNILLISLDACRADHLSSYGYHRKTSPFLDSIAAKGIRFANAFVNTHGTTTSHVTLLTSLYQESHKVDYDIKFVPRSALMIQEILKAHGYTTLAVTDGGRLAHQFGFDRGFIEYDDRGGGVLKGSKKLIKLINKHRKKDKNPIFAFFHTYEIHSPYFPPKKYQSIFGEYKSGFKPSSGNLVEFSKKVYELKQEDLEYIKAMYDAGIRYTDDILQNLFNELQESGFLENYLLIITADHGEEFGEHGGLLHLNKLYDELLHVPLIITGSNIPKGVVDKRLVGSVDIVPTILNQLNIKRLKHMGGISLLSQESLSKEKKEAIFSQYGNLRYSIRTLTWKLIENRKPLSLEFYNLEKDPQEHNNVSAQYPDLVSQFQNRIKNWKKRVPDLSESISASKERPKEKLSKKQIEQLKSLGYVSDSKKRKKEIVTEETFNQLVKLKLPETSNNIKFSIANLEVEDTFIKIRGWAFIKGQNAINSQIFIALVSPQKTYLFDTYVQIRADVSRHFKVENLDDSGFISIIEKRILNRGKYQVGIYIKKDESEAYQLLNRYITIE